MASDKNNPNINLFYSDTDSIVIKGDLPEHLRGDKLGNFKLEHEIEIGIFLSPKVFALLTKGGKVIIKIKGPGGELNR